MFLAPLDKELRGGPKVNAHNFWLNFI